MQFKKERVRYLEAILLLNSSDGGTQSLSFSRMDKLPEVTVPALPDKDPILTL